MSDILDEGSDGIVDEAGDGLLDATPSSVVASANWQFIVGGIAPSGIRERELYSAYGRTLTFRIDGICTAQFTVNGRHDEASVIVDLGSDLSCLRNGVLYYRGRIASDDDTIDENTHISNFYAIDYRGMLAKRFVGTAGVVYSATDQAAIAWGLIATTQATTSGNWGITNGVGSTSATTRDNTLPPGKDVMSAIDDMGRLNNGYEWEIDELLALNRWYPKRGSNNGVVLDYGGTIAKVTRRLSNSSYGNFAVAIGAQGTTPTTATSGTIGTDPLGRLEVAQQYPTIIDQSTLTDKATWLLGQINTLRPDYIVTFAPGRWQGKTHVWLGDTVTLNVVSGRLSVVGSFRVIEITIVPGEQGRETVTMGLLAT